MLAARQGHDEVVMQLVAAGADIHLQDKVGCAEKYDLLLYVQQLTVFCLLSMLLPCCCLEREHGAHQGIPPGQYEKREVPAGGPGQSSSAQQGE